MQQLEKRQRYVFENITKLSKSPAQLRKAISRGLCLYQGGVQVPLDKLRISLTTCVRFGLFQVSFVLRGRHPEHRPFSFLRQKI